MNVLVVVAHSDDETLGCGGTIRRLADEGHEVFAVSLTDGVGSRGADESSAAARESASDRAAALLGFHWHARGSFPDNALDTCQLLALAQFVEAAKRAIRPGLVLTHSPADLNVDHQLAFRATLTAFRPQPGESCRELRCFEVLSSTEWSHPGLGTDFRPNCHVDITEQWQAKLAALEAYADEMRPWPHSRSLEHLDALARYRGGNVGFERAEAFEIIRRLE